MAGGLNFIRFGSKLVHVYSLISLIILNYGSIFKTNAEFKRVQKPLKINQFGLF